jgi:hypothetical protein
MFAGRGGGNLKVAYGSYTIAANLEINSTIDLCNLPSGAVVLGGMLIGEDLDTGTEALEIDIGTRTKGTAYGDSSADPDAFLNSGVLTGDALADHSPAAKILVHFSEFGTGPKTLTVDTTVFATFTAAAVAGGTGTIWVRVDYLMP